MSNVQYVYPVYFGFLREMTSRAEKHASEEFQHREGFDTTNRIYEIEALTNVIGELECARAECERRIRYLEAKAAEGI